MTMKLHPLEYYGLATAAIFAGDLLLQRAVCCLPLIPTALASTGVSVTIYCLSAWLLSRLK